VSPSHLAFLVVAVPLASAAAIALFLRRRGGLASALSVTTALAVALGAFWLALHPARFEASREWLSLGGLTVSFGFNFDDLAALMIAIVGLVGLCVHVFSLGYMHDDAAKARYFGGLSIFMFSMLGLVLADNLFMMFIFWELVGFSSWLLINHWYERPAAAAAAKKAFIVNRVGDVGFLLGIILCYHLRGTVNFSDLAAQASSGTVPYSRAIPLLLFCGAVGKSAQLPLQVWLPDAMEGPSPVSALIHAATMVAAGIYMLCRIQVVMVLPALDVIMWVGTATALYAALCAIGQRDIKKVLAYSTLSQLGYMVAAFGLGNHYQPQPDDPCLLQGAALPGGGLGDLRVPPRAGHLPHGRPGEADEVHLRDLHDRRGGHRRVSVPGGLLLQGCDPRAGLRQQPGGLRRPRLHGHPDRLLHGSALEDRLLRRHPLPRRRGGA
jgi:NADH-quinone oxidoreductase subunit L